MTEIHGTCRDGFESVSHGDERELRSRAGTRRLCLRHGGRRAGRRSVGGRCRRARPAVGAGHDRQRVLDHQDHGCDLRPDAGRPWRARPERSGGHLLARVRGEWQGGHPRPPRDEPHGRRVGFRPGDRPPRTSTTSRPSPRRLAGQAPWWDHARSPATTRSRKASCRASSCSGSPGVRSARSSARRSQHRSVPTSTSVSPRRRTTGSQISCLRTCR